MVNQLIKHKLEKANNSDFSNHLFWSTKTRTLFLACFRNPTGDISPLAVCSRSKFNSACVSGHIRLSCADFFFRRGLAEAFYKASHALNYPKKAARPTANYPKQAPTSPILARMFVAAKQLAKAFTGVLRTSVTVEKPVPAGRLSEVVRFSQCAVYNTKSVVMRLSMCHPTIRRRVQVHDNR